jgi:hypothetical protein
MPQPKKMETRVAPAANAEAEHVTPNTATQPEKEYLEMQKTNIPATESVLEVVERFVAQDKLLANSEEDDKYYDDDEESDDWTPDEAAEGTEPAVSVKEVVRKINEIATKTVERGIMEIGEYVLSEVFQDKLEDVLSQSPYKSASLRTISEDPELMVDRRRLGTYVRAAALKKELQGKNVDCANLRFSQLAALLKMRDEEKRAELAAEANQSGFSVRAILDRIEATKKQKPSNGKVQELLRKMEDPLGLLSDEDTRQLLNNPQRLKEDLEPQDRWAMVKIIDEAARKMEQSTSLFKEARVHLVRIELGSPEPEEA